MTSESKEGKLAGTSALVTGAVGIGGTVAEAYAREGAAVLLVDRDAERAAAAAQDLGDNVLAYRADVTDYDQMNSAFEYGSRELGAPLGHVALIAGIYPSLPLLGMTQEKAAKIDELIRTNLTSTLVNIGLAANFMIGKTHEHPEIDRQILVASSVNAYATFGPGDAPYAASKRGLEPTVRNAAYELASYGIRVNGIILGAVKTPGIEDTLAALPARMAEELSKAFLDHTIHLNYLQPKNIASTALYAATNSDLTGELVTLDSGYLASSKLAR